MSRPASTRIPLRTKEERMAFCDRYFTSVDAPVTYRADDYREYRLPRDVDKELTDRPYYWLWVEQTGQDVEPTTLRLAFTPDALERENKRLYDEAWANADVDKMSDIERMFFRPPTAELVSLGGFRLEKIINSVLARGNAACFRPQHCNDATRLIPWLLVNAVISYECDFTKQAFISLGVCLVNNQIVEDFYSLVSHIPMESITLETLFAQSANLDDTNGNLIDHSLQFLRNYLEEKLAHQRHDWADDARTRLADDLEQLDMYYASLLSGDPEADEPVIRADHQRKRRELISRAEPKIQINFSQAAAVGLVEKN